MGGNGRRTGTAPPLNTPKHTPQEPKPEPKPPKVPWYIRLLHWPVAIIRALCLLKAYGLDKTIKFLEVKDG